MNTIRFYRYLYNADLTIADKIDVMDFRDELITDGDVAEMKCFNGYLIVDKAIGNNKVKDLYIFDNTISGKTLIEKTFDMSVDQFQSKLVDDESNDEAIRIDVPAPNLDEVSQLDNTPILNTNTSQYISK